jgi:NAD(P)-dependent dehydrogenase (short-subunit alcohol dehydrogenase family)
MRIIIVGATGAVGSTAVNALSSRHEIISVGRNSGDVQADIEDIENIRAMYRTIGKVDAVVCAAGGAQFARVNEMTSEQFLYGINRKVLSQVNLVLEGFQHINDGGSFTLTSGVSNREPISGGAAASAANGALDGFVIGAAVDMPRDIRINAVSPEALEVSREKHPDRFYGHRHVSSEAVGLAYSKSVEGCLNGQIFIVE